MTGLIRKQEGIKINATADYDERGGGDDGDENEQGDADDNEGQDCAKVICSRQRPEPAAISNWETLINDPSKSVPILPSKDQYEDEIIGTSHEPQERTPLGIVNQSFNCSIRESIA